MRRALLIVDPQNDFTEGGKLEVKGGRQALLNLALHIEKEGDSYNNVVITRDSHLPMHVATPAAWDEAHDFDTVDCGTDVKGRLKIPYVEAVEGYLNEVGQITLWPEHCIIGSEGHQISWVLIKALADHWENREVPYTVIDKGNLMYREQFSIFDSPEYMSSETYDFLQWLREDEEDTELVVAGLAWDYCVFETLKGLAREMGYRFLKKHVTLLKNCTAAINPGNEEVNGWMKRYVGNIITTG